MGETNSNQFMHSKKKLVFAVEHFGREENLSPVLIPTMSKDMDEQLKLSRSMVDIVNRANKKICLTLLHKNKDKPERFYTKVRLFARKKEDVELHQSEFVKYKLEEIIHLFDRMYSVFDKTFTNQPICNVP